MAGMPKFCAIVVLITGMILGMTSDPKPCAFAAPAQKSPGKGWVQSNDEAIVPKGNAAPQMTYLGDKLKLHTKVVQIDVGAGWNPVDRASTLLLQRDILTADGFHIFWTDVSMGNTLPDSKRFWVECNSDGSVHVRNQKAWYDQPVQVHEGNAEGTVVKTVPKSIMLLAAELGYVKEYYAQAGYEPAAEMLITVHRNLKKGPNGELNAGEWDPITKHMIINPSILNLQDSGARNKRQATLAHEYFHAIFQYHGYKEGDYPGLEDCLTTTFEAEVFPGNDDFLGLHSNDMGPALASGLRVMGPGETAQSRGYTLWPWGRYILHAKGHEAIRKLVNPASDNGRPAFTQTLFREFIEALMANGKDLNALLPQVPPVAVSTKQMSLLVKTGWEKTDYATFIPLARGQPAFNPNVSFSPGNYDLPGVLQSPRPLAFFELGVKFMGIPKLSPDDYPLPDAPVGIVRRLKPDKAESFILAVPPSAHLTALARSQTTAVIRREGGAVITREWMEQSPGQDLLFAVGVAGMSTGEQIGESNPLLIYYLPRFKGLKLEPSASSSTTTSLKWDELPDIGVPRSLVLSGYRVFGRDANNKQMVLANLFIPRSSLDFAGTHDGQTFPIGEDARSIDLPKTMLAPYDTVGLAVVDAAMKDAEGKPLVGEIAWLDVGGTVDGTVDKGGENPQPAVGTPVSLTYTLGPSNPVKMPIVKTDSQGGFAFHNIPGGAEFTVSAGNSDEKRTMPVPPKRMTVHLTVASEMDLSTYLLPKDGLPMDLKETARDYTEELIQKMATQDLASPKAADGGGGSQSHDYNDNPVLPAMNGSEQEVWEAQQKAMALSELAKKQEAKKPKKRQIIARVTIQRPKLSVMHGVLMKGLVEMGHLTKQPDGSFRTPESADKMVILWERDDLIVAVSCLAGDGDMRVLETLKAVEDQHITAVNAGKNKR